MMKYSYILMLHGPCCWMHDSSKHVYIGFLMASYITSYMYGFFKSECLQYIASCIVFTMAIIAVATLATVNTTASYNYNFSYSYTASCSYILSYTHRLASYSLHVYSCIYALMDKYTVCTYNFLI